MRRALALVAALVLAFTLTACGDEETPSTPGASEPAGGSTDDGGDVEVLKPCDAITADEVGAIIGASVTAELEPFDDCGYDQEDPRALSVMIGAEDLAKLGGGYETYKAGSGMTLDAPEITDLSGVGDQAYVAVGTFAGGENLQLSGAAEVGGQLITVNLTQAQGLDAATLVGYGKALLELAVSKV